MYFLYWKNNLPLVIFISLLPIALVLCDFKTVHSVEKGILKMTWSAQALKV